MIVKDDSLTSFVDSYYINFYVPFLMSLKNQSDKDKTDQKDIELLAQRIDRLFTLDKFAPKDISPKDLLTYATSLKEFKSMLKTSLTSKKMLEVVKFIIELEEEVDSEH